MHRGIRDYLATIMTSGTPTERKAATETLIHEVQLTDQGVITRVQDPNHETPLPDRSDLKEDGSPVRGRWAGRDSNPRPRDYESPALTR